MSFFKVLLSFCFLLEGMRAQEAPEPEEEKKVPMRQIRILAVGNMPPHRQEVRDGIRYELPPPPGSIPPRKLMLIRPGKDEEVELGEIRLTLGRISQPLEIPLGGTGMILRDDKGGEWMKIKTPEEGNFLIVMWRNPEVGVWNKPRHRLVADAREPGSIRFLNVSGKTVALILGEERLGLKPLQVMTRPLAENKPVAFQLGFPDAGGKLVRGVSQSVEQSVDESTLIVVCDSDGEHRRRPLKVTRLRERIR